MSWGIKIAGSPKAVKQFVAIDGNIPEAVKVAINTIVDDFKPAANVPAQAILLETYGHFGGGYSTIGKLEINPVQIVPELAEAAPTPEGSAAAQTDGTSSAKV